MHRRILEEDHLVNGITKLALVNPLIYLGPTGALRASCRAIDETLSTKYWPEHDYSRSEKLKTGEVVKPDIGL